MPLLINSLISIRELTVKIIVTIIPPSGPKSPPVIHVGPVNFVSIILEFPIIIPLTGKPKTFPINQFHMECWAKIPHKPSSYKAYKDANIPYKIRFIIGSIATFGLRACKIPKKSEEIIIAVTGL